MEDIYDTSEATPDQVVATLEDRSSACDRIVKGNRNFTFEASYSVIDVSPRQGGRHPVIERPLI